MRMNMVNTTEHNYLDSKKCQVCGEKATNFVAYGGKCCACCRQFFRRSVVRMSRYSCPCKESCSHKDVLCVIDKTTRNDCKRCRFVKCEISAGMKSKWVLEQYIPKVEKLNKQDMVIHSLNKNIGMREDKSILNDDSLDALESMKNTSSKKLKQTIGTSHCLKARERFNNPGQADIDIALIICKNYDDQYKSVKHGEQIIKQILFGVLYNVSFGVEYQKTALRIQTQRIVRIAKCFPDFCGLSDKLQHLLLKQNAFMMYTLIQASIDNFNSLEFRVRKCFHPDDAITMTHLYETIIAYNVENEDQLRGFKPEKNVILREFNDDETHKRYQVLKSQIRERTAHDYNAATLMGYALLFSCDDISCEKLSNHERQSINDLQGKILVILERYLNATNSKSQALIHFTKLMEMLVILKEVQDIAL